ncbi:MAG: ribonuclease catalytic domain-containing protein [Desulfovibrio sp.]
MSRALKDQLNIRAGSVVEYMHGNQPQLAWVQEESNNRLRLLTINKRETTIPAGRILPWTGPVHSPDASRQEVMDALTSHQEKRGEIQASLDVLELWHLAQGEVESANINWFAELLWEEPNSDQIAALGCAMLNAKTHFKFQPPKFHIYSEEKVEQRLKLLAEEKEREAATLAGQTVFQALWQSFNTGKNPDFEEDRYEPAVLDNLKELLMSLIARNTTDKQNKLWSATKKGLPDTPHVPLFLAQRWGLVGKHHNFHLDEAGFKWGDDWHAPFAEEIKEMHAEFEQKVEPSHPDRFISIDAPTTKDIDDAFSVSRTEDGYRLLIALARPSLSWRFDGPLDKAVFNRATSLYLPEGTGHMMPEEFGTGLYSLIEKEARPSLITEFLFDNDGKLVKTTPTSSWVTVEANWTYEASNQAILEKSDEMLVIAHELSIKLREQRLSRGAVIIEKPDPFVRIEGKPDQPEIILELKEPCPESENVISEFMIISNSGLGKWAHENDVPLLYRTQDLALPQESGGIYTDPAAILRVVKLLMPPTLELNPKRHAALAVEAYSPITSPLRRYTDLINLAQVESKVETGEPRLDADTLENTLMLLTHRVQAVSQVQRFRPRYWKLVYISRKRKQMHSAIVVEENGHYPSLAMPQYQINVRVPRKLLGEKLYPGQYFQIRFGKVDPLTNEIKVVEALEE